MKKKSLKHKKLNLRKKVVSNLASENVKGGFTAVSCLFDQDGNCGVPDTFGCPSAGCPSTGCPPQTQNCPSVGCPTYACPPMSFSCEPVGIC